MTANVTTCVTRCADSNDSALRSAPYIGVQAPRTKVVTPGCYLHIRSSFFGWVYEFFHVSSLPLRNQEFILPFASFFPGFFAMFYAPFVRLGRGFVSRRVVNSIVARSMASERKHKVLVTRKVPQAAVDILKSSQR